MFDNTPGDRVNDRLRRMARSTPSGPSADPGGEPPWDVLDAPDSDAAPDEPDQRAQGPPSSRAAPRLAEHWTPGGDSVVHRVLAAARRRPLAAGAVVLLLVAGLTMVSMLSSAPRPVAAPALPRAVAGFPAAGTAAASAKLPAKLPTKLIVSVVGKVARPGLVTLADGARVADALRAAGGVRPGARVLTLNLARRVADGEQIYVGIPVPPGASAAPVASGAVGSVGSVGSAVPGRGSAGGKLDLNTASAAQLDELPGIGEVTAQSILDWRTQHGRFSSIGQLNDVDGIGEVRFGRLKDLVEIR
jgi:competence protein ComEA